MTLSTQSRSRPYSVIYRDPTVPHEQALGDSGKEKLPFNGKKPRTESGRAAICLDRFRSSSRLSTKELTFQFGGLYTQSMTELPGTQGVNGLN